MTRKTIGEGQGWHVPAYRGQRYVRQVTEHEQLVVERQKEGWLWRFMIRQRARAGGEVFYPSVRAAQAAADAYWNERA